MGFKLTKSGTKTEVPELIDSALPQATVEKKVAVTKGANETVRISFRMVRSLHTRLKLEAVRQGRSIVAMLEGFVSEHTPTV